MSMSDTSVSPPASISPAHPLRARITAEFRALWQLAWPIMIGQLAVVGISVTDVAMAGHASSQDLAGVSLGVAIWNLVMMSIMGVMMSVSPLVAHLVGAKDFEGVPHVVRQGLWKALIVGLLGLAVCFASASVFDAMELDPVEHVVAGGFVQIGGLAMPAFAIYRTLYGYSASIDQTKPMMVISILALLLNIFINWMLVFGHLGFEALGGLGCAWSTTICMWFNMIALLLWMQRDKAYARTWPLSHFEWPHWKTLAEMFRLGLPVGITYLAEASAFCLIALLVARFGSTEVASHQVALNFTSFTFMVPLSLGVALLTRVGQALGAGDPREARFRSWVGVAGALFIAVVTASIMVLFSKQIASIYTSDALVAQRAATLLLLAALFQLSDCTQVVISFAMRGYKVTRAPLAIHMVAFWVFSLPLGYLLGVAPDWNLPRPDHPLGAVGFWIALIVGLSVAAIGLTFLLRLTARQMIMESEAA